MQKHSQIAMGAEIKALASYPSNTKSSNLNRSVIEGVAYPAYGLILLKNSC